MGRSHLKWENWKMLISCRCQFETVFVHNCSCENCYYVFLNSAYSILWIRYLNENQLTGSIPGELAGLIDADELWVTKMVLRTKSWLFLLSFLLIIIIVLTIVLKITLWKSAHRNNPYIIWRFGWYVRGRVKPIPHEALLNIEPDMFSQPCPLVLG
jgi:hypothetical protein